MSQGMLPFMSILLLVKGAEGVVHEPCHNLESLFYVMIYCATMLKGLHQCWQVPDDFKAYSSMPMKEWFGLDGLECSYASMAQMKTGHMSHFEDTIIVRMDPYSSLLFAGIEDLRDAIFPHTKGTYLNPQIKWQKMRDILNRILASLPEKHKKREADPAVAEMGQGVKHKRHLGEF
jgi:hypothetical protein